jgi:hypothetical protein
MNIFSGGVNIVAIYKAREENTKEVMHDVLFTSLNNDEHSPQ